MDIDEMTIYEIAVAGMLDPAWSEWLDDLVVTTQEGSPPITVLRGNLDQPALRGVLNRIWDLNLTLISVTPDGPDGLSTRSGGRNDG